MTAPRSMTPQGKGPLPRTRPYEVGIDPAAITAFVQTVNEQVGGLHSMMLLRHGQVAAEAWWDPFTPDEPHILYSLSKSFTSTAAGLAISEGRFALDERVISFFPDKLPEVPDDHLQEMRVRDLLTMSTGHESEPFPKSDDWVKDFLAAPVPRKPGTHFLYNTPATHVAAAIVQKTTGERLLDYLASRLFEPLGIEDATWVQSPAGVDAGGYGLKLKTEDIAKFGQLLLQKGEWNGQRIVPESWVEEATRKQVSNGDPTEPHDWSQGYGYQFWRCRHEAYRGDGAFGQFCIVMPAQDVVLAITSGVGDMGAILEAVWTHLLPGMVEPGSSEGEEALKAELVALKVPAPVGQATSPLASKVSGHIWKMATNAEGIETVQIRFEGDGGTVETTGANGSQRLAFGTEEWVRTKPDLAAQGAWAGEDRFTLRTYRLDSPHAWDETYVFEGDRLEIRDRAWNLLLFGPREREELHGQKISM
ncbi:hypothetical protein BH11ARM2_BH11ARM2_10760 [soil metagenome]